MSEDNIDLVLSALRLPNEDIRTRARTKLDSLTKPVGSLGRIEDVAMHYLGIIGKVAASRLDPVVCTLAADHGVTAEGGRTRNP